MKGISNKYRKNPSRTVDATGRTRKVNGQMDRQTDRRTDRQTGWIQYTPLNSLRGYNDNFLAYFINIECHLMVKWMQGAVWMLGRSKLTHWGWVMHILTKNDQYILVINSSWPSATYMRRDFQCLFPQRPRYVALISVLISPVPHTWGVTNGSLLASPPNSRRSPASLISPAPHICGASRTPILTRVVWKILNVAPNILVVLPDYRLP